MIVPTIAEIEAQLGIDSRVLLRTADATCQHQPTVEHHTDARASFARCWSCGATASPVHWPTATNPPESTTAATNNFRQEINRP